MKKLRLLLWAKCNRSCELCCNKDWDLNALERTRDFTGYKEIILTGGEPMLNPSKVIEICKEIRQQTDVPIYMYTAKMDDLGASMAVLKYLDGITLTLHEQKDVDALVGLNALIYTFSIKRSFRLNVFKEVNLNGIDVSKWKVRDEIVWLKDCPLPTDEEFKAYGG